MKTQTTLGSFIAVMGMLAEQAVRAAGVADYSLAEVVPLGPIVRLMTLNLSRPAWADDCPGDRIFRFCSSPSATRSSFLLSFSSNSQIGELGTHTGRSKRRAK